MKVFHGTTEIAGQMGILSEALQKKGHYSIGYNTFHSYLGYEDHLVNTDEQTIEQERENIIPAFDVFHFHYGTTLSPGFEDLEKIARLGKKMVMHHWGNDVRFHDIARIHNPYVYTGDSPPNEVMHERLTKMTRYIKQAIVQDYEMVPYVENYYDHVHVVPIAIDLSQFTPAYPDPMKKRPLILHAPTNPDFKGTAHVENAIEQLRKEYDFDYKRIEKLKHSEAIELYKEADLIIDQVLCGSHGLLSVETMALGKPVVTYIREDLISRFPSELPIVNANPDTLYDQVKKLLENPSLRRTHGEQGRKYVEAYHSSDVVIEQLLAIYEQL